MTHLDLMAKVSELEGRLNGLSDRVLELEEQAREARRKFKHFHDLANFDANLIHALYEEIDKLGSEEILLTEVIEPDPDCSDCCPVCTDECEFWCEFCMGGDCD